MAEHGENKDWSARYLASGGASKYTVEQHAAAMCQFDTSALKNTNNNLSSCVMITSLDSSEHGICQDMRITLCTPEPRAFVS
jgi:hypothetical protein